MSDSSLAQGPEPVQPPRELAIEQIKKSVVFISGTYEENGQQKTASGTGFFIFLPDTRLGENQGLVWLVTNKHVLRQPLPDGTPGPYFNEVIVRFNTKEPVTAEGRQFEENRIRVPDHEGNLVWFIDPDDENVDLALIHVAPNEEKVDAKWVPTELFVTKAVLAQQHVNENDEVLFTGLFPWHPGRKKNYPIVRHGKLALLPDERIPIDRRRPNVTAELYLAEITSFGGNSGSPVFLRLGGIRETPAGAQAVGYRYYLLGVMQGFFPEASEFAIEVTRIRGTVGQNSGIAAVIPAHKILRILETPKARQYIETVVDRILKTRQKQSN